VAQRILVVDDDIAIIKIVVSYLEQEGFEVLSAADGDHALQIVRHDRPDLVVLDIMLPDRDGWEVIRAIRSDASMAATPIILLTARIEDTDKIVGLELGADDYITKPFNAREVVARVRALLRRTELDRGRNMVARVLLIGNIRLDIDQHTATVNNIPVELTRTEFKLLQVLMESPGYILTRDDLLEKAMGYAYEGMGRALDTHIRNLRKKIEADPDNPLYIQTVYGVGYRMATPAMNRGGQP
jgi:DNA-binding response OmpR family regulator